MRRTLTLCVAIILLFGMLRNVWAEKPKRVVTVSSKPAATAATSKPMERTLDVEDNGAAINAHVGDIINVRLRTSPGTGYHWRCNLQGDALKLESQKTAPPPPPTDGISRPQSVTFRFLGVSSGKATIECAYVKGEQKDPSETGRFLVKVTVSENTK